MFKGAKTFRPKKKFEEGTLRYNLHKKATAALDLNVNLHEAVVLPPDEDPNEWYAVHVVDFFNRINLIYGTVSDFCTKESCPTMSAGVQYEYYWQDDRKYKKPTRLSAPEYIELLMDWIEMAINDEAVFPPSVDTPFPKNFAAIVKQIFRRMFRVFAHVYYHHFSKLAHIGAEAHVNTCYKHFFIFVKEFDLIPDKELEPLKDLSKSLSLVKPE
mmetsp:Transcript_16897/g.43964  ORF Transcript_16897/g.43964 Transcript_16897/m.43964 type:complete len:214 (+) Transcript_16897:113-754(+)